MIRSMIFTVTLFLVGWHPSTSSADVAAEYNYSSSTSAATNSVKTQDHVINPFVLPTNYSTGYSLNRKVSWNSGDFCQRSSGWDHLRDGLYSQPAHKLTSCFPKPPFGLRRAWHRTALFLRIPHVTSCHEWSHDRPPQREPNIGSRGDTCGCHDDSRENCGYGSVGSMLHNFNPSHLLGNLLIHCQICFEQCYEFSCLGNCSETLCECNNDQNTYYDTEKVPVNHGESYENENSAEESDEHSYHSVPTPESYDSPPVPPQLDQSTGPNQWFLRPADT